MLPKLNNWLLREPDVHRRQSNIALALAAGLAVATLSIVWFAYVATREWRRGAELLQQRRSAEALALAHDAIVRDMRGAWLDLIVPITTLNLDEDPPYDLLRQASQTFAKFPYPESVVTWRRESEGVRSYAFNRADRQPPWDTSVRTDDPFPVTMLSNPASLAPILDHAQYLAESAQPYAVYETVIGGVPYQVLLHLMFEPNSPRFLTGVIAITVNLNWVRDQYFGPLLTQIARIGGDRDRLRLAVMDAQRVVVASTSTRKAGEASLEQGFPLVFLDQNLFFVGPSLKKPLPEFSVLVYEQTAAPQTALNNASWTLAVMSLAGLASVIALMLTVRAVRASVLLTSMKSDFISAVTHELKTPVASIRLVGDTLARGRYPPEAIHEYAKALSQEAARLTRSIDQLLTYASYTNTKVFKKLNRVSIALSDLVDDALEHFHLPLVESGFSTKIQMSSELPLVLVDPEAIVQVLEIIIDNAIKYSPHTRSLEILATHERSGIRLTIRDRGIGIHPDDLSHICERFFRGRNARVSGTGLGLAIAARIMRHHGGALSHRSVLGDGTEVDLVFPVAR